MIYGQVVDRDEICRLIPHAGKMCLLDKVLQWDEKYIACNSSTHQDVTNPLRNHDKLPVSALIEYGAQAMAVHGGLLASASGAVMHEGYLAALRDVTIINGDVSRINSLLYIEATQQLASNGNMIYNFTVRAEKEILISGRATVMAVFHD